MEEAKIDKLQAASQWPRWKFHVRVTLNASGLYEVVNGDNPKPLLIKEDAETDAQAQVRHNKDLLEWKRLDGKAQRIIVNALGPQAMQLIMRFNTSSEMWNKLISVYEQKSETHVYMLQQRFFSAVMDPSDNIVGHISKLEDIAQQLKDQNEEISNTMIISKVLMTLPPCYSHFHSAWESTASENRTIDNLTARLMIEESRLLQSSSSSLAPVESSAMAAKSNNRFRFSQKSHTVKATQKPTGNCFLCNKPGHFKRDCPSRNMRHTATANISSARESDSCDAFTSVVGYSSSVCNDDRWFLDTGASDHMTHRKDWFESLSSIEAKPIHVGNGNIIYACGKGTIKIQVFDGSRWCDKSLLNVLYAPKISLNLFSVGSALDVNKGLVLETNSVGCCLKLKGVTVAVGERNKRLYEMKIKVVNNNANQSQAMAAYTLKEWHEILAHQNIKQIRSFLSANKITVRKDNLSDFFCEDCVFGKQHRSTFKSSSRELIAAGELVVSDVCGPMQVASIGGARYFVVFKDQFTHYRVVFFIKEKSEVKNCLKRYLQNVSTEMGHSIKCFRSDNGLEYANADVSTILQERGIQHQRTVPFTPEQNGSAEREMRTIVEAARTMLHAKNLPTKLWAEAVNTAVFVLNRSGTSSVVDKTPYSLWYNKNPDILNMHVFGSSVFVHIPKEKRRKWDPKSTEGVFVGYGINTKGFRVWLKDSDKIVTACDVIFAPATSEVSNVDTSVGDNLLISEDTDSDDNCECDQRGSSGSGTSSRDSSLEAEAVVNAEGEKAVVDNNRRELRDRSKMPRPIYVEQDSFGSEDSFLYFAELIEPLSYKQALQSEESTMWKNAMNEEMASLEENNTWTLVDLPRGRKVIDNRWVFKVKRMPNGDIERFKARLVVRGFSQIYGIDYQETFSPVVKFASIRLILAVAAAESLCLRQFDIKTAFLYGDLDEEIYMKQPDGFSDSSGKVCRLNRSLYGLKQASRCWNLKFTNFLKKFKLSSSEADSCVFVGSVSGRKIILAIYIDDGLIAASDEKDILLLLNELKEQFKFKSSTLDTFLGLEVSQKLDGSIHVNQAGYARRLLQKFKMIECNPVATPADQHHSMSSSEDSASKMGSAFPYREAVGSLMYLATGTRPDIAFAVNNASRHLENPMPCHWTAVKRIFKYIKGTIGLGITFKQTTPINLLVYSDADYGGDLDTRRSTTGYVLLIGGGAISWSSQRQPTVALSTTESEYIAACQTLKELIWMSRLLREIVPSICGVPNLNIDNQSAIKLIKNPQFHKRTKHIDIKFHFIREQFEKSVFQPCYVQSEDQIADILTKALPKESFIRFRQMMGVHLN